VEKSGTQMNAGWIDDREPDELIIPLSGKNATSDSNPAMLLLD
jgi:hypothetical protein